MKIIEHTVVGKKDIETCEDFVVLSDNFVAVIDGATAQSSKNVDGVAPGRLIAEALAQHIPHIPIHSDSKEGIKFLVSKINKEIIQPHFSEDMGTVRAPNASVIIFSKDRKELWRIGDCNYAIDGKVNMKYMLVDEAHALIRSEIISHAILTGARKPEELTENDPGREFLQPLFQRQHVFANNTEAGEWAYGEFDATPKSLHFLEVIILPDQAELVLASDGYPKIFSTLQDSENYLSDILSKDPLLYKEYKSTKGLQEGNVSFDDRAYLRLKY